jgi:quercetin dioxygenase-like cupin family protein
MLLSRRDPNHITGADFLDRTGFALSPAKASRDDESLTMRMRDPLFQAPDPAIVQGASVTFEPGARTAWHKVR